MTDWCNKAKQELTPDLYSRWQEGQLLTAEEKREVLRSLAIKWGLRDQRACCRMLEKCVATSVMDRLINKYL